jgi:hypothetical protein
MDEVEENFKNFDFFSGLMEGLQEALAYSNGDAKTDILVHDRSTSDACEQ